MCVCVCVRGRRALETLGAGPRALLSATVCVGLYPHIAARRAGETSFRTERGLKVQTFDELTSTHGFHV